MSLKSIVLKKRNMFFILIILFASFYSIANSQEELIEVAGGIFAALFGWFFFIYPVLNKTTIYLRTLSVAYKSDFKHQMLRFVYLIIGLLFFSEMIRRMIYPNGVNLGAYFKEIASKFFL